MILTTRFAKRFVASWGLAGSLTRGMLMLLLGAALLTAGQLLAAPSFWTFVVPMWVIATGIVFAASVTAHGALQAFGSVAGTAVALLVHLARRLPRRATDEPGAASPFHRSRVASCSASRLWVLTQPSSPRGPGWSRRSALSRLTSWATSIAS